MRHITPIAGLLLSLLLRLDAQVVPKPGANNATGPASSASNLNKPEVDKIDVLVDAFRKKYDVPGLSISIVGDGAKIWSKGYGLANLENEVPSTPATMYRTASIGKTMTATAAMQLVEKGKLDLDAEIQQYCPAFPRKDKPITSRMLISHRSGIRHYGGPRDREEQASAVHYANVIDALAPFRDDPLLFEPGTKFGYSTYGYNVLACVIQGTSGETYLDYMREHIWKAAGMDVTRDDDPAVIVKNRAAGYVTTDGKLRIAPFVDMSNRIGGGGFLTTVDDLARFAVSIFDGKLVGAQTFEKMREPAVLASGEKIPYGMGWAVELEEWHGDIWTSHGGSSPGVAGLLALMPKHRFAIAILTNQEAIPGDARGDLAGSIARVVLKF